MRKVRWNKLARADYYQNIDYLFRKFAEKDEETGYNQFEARIYDSRLGRWLVPDPAGQHFSPYLGMGNNPVCGVDPNGMWVYTNWFTGEQRDYQNNKPTFLQSLAWKKMNTMLLM